MTKYYENYDDMPEPTQEQQDFMGMENYIMDLEEAIEELEDHMVHDHDCARPSIVERVSYRDERKGQ